MSYIRGKVYAWGEGDPGYYSCWAFHEDWPDDGGKIAPILEFPNATCCWRSLGALDTRNGLLQLERHLREHRTREDAPGRLLKRALHSVRKDLLAVIEKEVSA